MKNTPKYKDIYAWNSAAQFHGIFFELVFLDIEKEGL